jgi:hypothetical protein
MSFTPLVIVFKLGLDQVLTLPQVIFHSILVKATTSTSVGGAFLNILKFAAGTVLVSGTDHLLSMTGMEINQYVKDLVVSAAPIALTASLMNPATIIGTKYGFAGKFVECYIVMSVSKVIVKKLAAKLIMDKMGAAFASQATNMRNSPSSFISGLNRK